MTRISIFVVLLALASAPLSAQAGGRGMAAGRTMRVPDPILFNGPPPPEDFLDLVSLDSTQYDAYRQHYTSFMDSTRAQRDTLMEFRRQMRDAMGPMDPNAPAPEMRGRSGGGGSRGQIEKTLSELEKKQKEFDEGLKPILREAQLKRYEAWRKEELARAEREMRERFGGPPR
jgi:hypothetical protein